MCKYNIKKGIWKENGFKIPFSGLTSLKFLCRLCIRDGPIPVSVSEISAYRHFFKYRQYRTLLYPLVSVSAVSAVSAKASIGISAYRQKCGIGPSLIWSHLLCRPQHYLAFPSKSQSYLRKEWPVAVWNTLGREWFVSYIIRVYVY